MLIVEWPKGGGLGAAVSKRNKRRLNRIRAIRLVYIYYIYKGNLVILH